VCPRFGCPKKVSAKSLNLIELSSLAESKALFIVALDLAFDLSLGSFKNLCRHMNANLGKCFGCNSSVSRVISESVKPKFYNDSFLRK
jgi:hypothetical protein